MCKFTSPVCLHNVYRDKVSSDRVVTGCISLNVLSFDATNNVSKEPRIGKINTNAEISKSVKGMVWIFFRTT